MSDIKAKSKANKAKSDWKFKKGRVTIDGKDYGKIKVKDFTIDIEDKFPKTRTKWNFKTTKIITFEANFYLPLNIRIKNWIIDKWKSLKGVNEDE